MLGEIWVPANRRHDRLAFWTPVGSESETRRVGHRCAVGVDHDLVMAYSLKILPGGAEGAGGRTRSSL